MHGRGRAYRGACMLGGMRARGCQTYTQTKSAQKGEHETRTTESSSSIITGSNILLLDFLIFT